VNDELKRDLEGSGRSLILRYYPNIYLEKLRKNKNSSVRIADLRAEIRNLDLPNMKQEC
jgi:hypothetical protein